MMKHLLLLPLLVLFPFAAASPAAEEAPNYISDQEKAEGWTLLFDGQTLNGWQSWKTRKAVEAGGAWAVADDALTLEKKGGGDLYTEKAYENFEFTVDYKTAGNSGLFIRVNPEAKGAIWHSAPEVQVERDKGSKSTSAGGLYALIDVGEKTIDPDGWNTIRIRIKDNKGTHWFNGKEVYSYEIGSDDWNERVAKSKFGKHAGFAKLEKGHIGLQDHGAKVQFRNMKIRER